MEFNEEQQSPILFFVFIFVVMALIVAMFSLNEGEPLNLIIFSTIFFLALIYVLFGKLITVVELNEIQLSFGVGIINKQIKTSQIASVECVRNKWWYGYGIRLTSHGWMWNMKGLDAVELTFKESGKKFRIGTQKSEELAAILKNKIS